MNIQAIKNFLRRGYLYIRSIENNIYKRFAILLANPNFKFVAASILYITIYGLMVVTILHYFLKFPFTAEGLFACGFLSYIIRYELIEWLQDLRAKR